MNRVDAITSSVVWDRALLALPRPQVLQSWTWGALKESQHWQATRFLWRDGYYPVAAAQVLVQRRGRLRLGYVPKGPLLNWHDTPLAAIVLSRLAAFAREQNLTRVKIAPDVGMDTREGQAVLTMLKQQEWAESFERVQFSNTMLLDLRPSVDVLLAQMKSKWRYNARLSMRRGVRVREARLDDLPLLYAMYAETAQRDGFIIREQAYYLAVWQRFMDAGLALPLIAEWTGKPLAMVFLLYFGHYAWYMYGASRSTQRHLMPNHRLQLEALRRLKALGCRVYDLWGAPDELTAADPLWGVYRFKLGMGANFVSHIGAYDYPPHPWLYRLYALARPHLITLAQQRYWSQVDDSQAQESASRQVKHYHS